ncbi:MAG: hypothetical protein GY869_31605 [Planctomycetes bacterium]|nr:hypothetical protein [Planctomycetota bacterium]
MKTRVLTIIMVAAIFSVIVPTGYGQTNNAKGLVEFKNIPSSNVLFQNAEIINTLLQTTCSEQVFEMVFGKPYGTAGYEYHIMCNLEARSEVVGQDMFNYLFTLEINHDGGDSVVLRDATVEWLEDFVASRHAETMGEINGRLSMAMENAAEAENRLVKLQAEQQLWIVKGGQGVLSRSQAQDQLSRLRKEKLNAELDLRGTEARSYALQEQIAKVAAEIEEKIANDPILAEMQKVLEISEKSLQRTEQLFKNEMVSEQEVYKSQQAVIRAKIDMVSRRESISKSVNNDSLAKWNSELANIAIRRAEQEVYLEYTSVQLAEIEGNNLLELAGRIEQLGMEIDQDRASLCEANREAERIRREMQSIREPKVALLGDN